MSSTPAISNRFWNPLSWWQRHPDEQICPLYHFPTELRLGIWSYVSLADHKSIKQVCKRFQFDINQIIGVSAILSGAESSYFDLGFVSEFPFIRRYTELDKNANWIRSVLPRQLTLRRISKITIDISNVVSEPRLLRGLSIQMDESDYSTSAKRFQQILKPYIDLKHLSVTSHSVDLQREQFSSFIFHGVTVAHETLNSLEFKHNLTDLSISVKSNIRCNRYVLFGYYEARIIGTILDTSTEATNNCLQTPVRLTHFDVHLPMLWPTALYRWKKLLDGQDRLTHLTSHFGLVHWSFYRQALQKSVATLEAVDLVLTNWAAPDVYPSNDEILDEHWFNWNLIAPMAAKLKSIRLCTICADIPSLFTVMELSTRCWPHDTHNFQLLSGLVSLEKLVLTGIRINDVQLRSIFTELLFLRHVDLAYWTQIEELGGLGLEGEALEFFLTDLVQRSRNFCDCVKYVLEINRFVYIRLVDLSLIICAFELREVFLNQPEGSPYHVTWTYPPEP